MWPVGFSSFPLAAGQSILKHRGCPRFREKAVVNTYAETAPNVTFDELKRLVFGHGFYRTDFQIGADRALTRLTQPQQIFRPTAHKGDLHQ
jgi:hypothetical protein